MSTRSEKASEKRAERPERNSGEKKQLPSMSPVLSARGVALDRMGNRALGSMLRARQMQRNDRATQAVASDVQSKSPEGMGSVGSHGAALGSQLSGGDRLDSQTRGWMESRFGESFEEVRIHTGSRAAQMADIQQARAFTVGRDIVFGEGQFAPQTTEGKRLLAHELAHVVQQRQTEGAIAGERETEWDAHEVSRQVESGSRPAVSKRAVQGSIQREPKPRRFNPTTDLPSGLLEDLKRKGLITGDAPGPVIVGNVDPDLAAYALEALKTGRSPQVKSAAPLELPWFFPSPARPAVDLSAPIVPFGLSLWPPVNLDQVPPRAKPAPSPKSPPKVSPAPATAPKLVSAAGLPVTQAQLDALSSEALLAEMGKTLDWLRTNKVSSKESDQVGRYFSALCAVYRQQKDEIELHRRFLGHARSPAQIASDTVAALALKEELTHRFPSIVEPWEIPIQILKPEDRAEDSQIVDSGITLWSTGIEGTGEDTKLGFSTRNLDLRYLDNFSSLSVDPWTHDYVAWFSDGTQVAIPRALIDAPGADGSYSINTPGGVREFKPKDSTAAPVVLPPRINKASLPRLLGMIEKNRDFFDTGELLNLAGRNVITHESMGEAGGTLDKIMLGLMILKTGTSIGMGVSRRFGGGSKSGINSQETEALIVSGRTRPESVPSPREWVVRRFDKADGGVERYIGHHVESDTIIVLEVNQSTGTIKGTHPESGQSAFLENGQWRPAPGALPAKGAGKGAGLFDPFSHPIDTVPLQTQQRAGELPNLTLPPVGPSNVAPLGETTPYLLPPPGGIPLGITSPLQLFPSIPLFPSPLRTTALPKPFEPSVLPAGPAPKVATGTVVTSAAPPASMQMSAADKRTAETRQVLEQARANLSAAKAEVDKATAELAIAIDLRKQQPTGGGPFVKEFRDKLAAAQSKLREMERIESAAASEAAQVAQARNSIVDLEREIAEIDRKMAEIMEKSKQMRPPTSTPQGMEYLGLEERRAKAIEKLKERTVDLTRNVREQVASWTPGPKAKPVAMANAEAIAKEVPELSSVNGKPIDITTGAPMTTDDWHTDHIMSRNEIASDPRFILLDSAGRDTMINGIPENYLPLTETANTSKGGKSVNEWLIDRARAGKPIPPRMADALREANARARAAVEAMFKQLLKPK